MKKFIACLVSLLLLLSVCNVTLAWFVPGGTFMPPITATAVSHYFASGNGSKETPYVINKPVHLYNLAWLQDKGIFDDATYYFELGADVDMLAEDSTVSGAVPPIGTSAHPFRGYFDGQGYTISNLWVSSDPTDWAEKPGNAEEVDIGTDIGMFGSVVKNESDVTYVGNFYLRDAEVTTHVSTCNAGVAAGNLDASMSMVGVVNAKIDAKPGVEIHSQFSLVGKTSTGVNWADAPSDIQSGGGNLTIQPNNTADDTDPYYIYKAFSSGGSLLSDKQAVPGALEGTAYFYKTMTPGSIGGNGAQGVHFYNDANMGYSDTTISDVNFTSNALPADATQEESDFWAYYQSYYKSARFIKMGGTPNLTTIMNNGTSLDGLENGVWFKPKAAGQCALSFIHTTQSTDNYMSLYRFKRTTKVVNGETIETIEQGTLQEMQFILPKSLNNKNVVFYVVNLTKEDLGYEYVIGLGSAQQSNNAGFFYMMLAGSDENTGTATEGTGRILEKIDFLPAVPDYGTSADTVFASVHLPVLAINDEDTPGTTATRQTFYYAVSADDNLVHYYTDGTAVTMSEVAKPASGNYKESSADFFPRFERQNS
ncbi:MAG: hypothetical protein ACI4S9_06300 [Christensenellales bacterium]